MCLGRHWKSVFAIAVCALLANVSSFAQSPTGKGSPHGRQSEIIAAVDKNRDTDETAVSRHAELNADTFVMTLPPPPPPDGGSSGDDVLIRVER